MQECYDSGAESCAAGGAPGDAMHAIELRSLESEMLQMQQAPCPVSHHFGPGVYIRELTIPAGTIAVGHRQRFEHLNILLRGRIAMLSETGVVNVLTAPMIFVGQPGKKCGQALEDVVWLNVFSTEERDIEKLEEMLFDRSDEWMASQDASASADSVAREDDRRDYVDALRELGVSHEIALFQSLNDSDTCDMPDGFSYAIRDSSIAGRGYFVSHAVKAGDVIAPARIAGFRTPAGRFVNHSKTPNAEMRAVGGDIYLVALDDIVGALGGGRGEEVTVDYRAAFAVAKGLT